MNFEIILFCFSKFYVIFYELLQIWESLWVLVSLWGMGMGEIYLPLAIVESGNGDGEKEAGCTLPSLAGLSQMKKNMQWQLWRLLYIFEPKKWRRSSSHYWVLFYGEWVSFSFTTILDHKSLIDNMFVLLDGELQQNYTSLVLEIVTTSSFQCYSLLPLILRNRRSWSDTPNHFVNPFIDSHATNFFEQGLNLWLWSCDSNLVKLTVENASWIGLREQWECMLSWLFGWWIKKMQLLTSKILVPHFLLATVTSNSIM